MTKIIIIGDQRVEEDFSLGQRITQQGWNKRPYYLINKILQNDPSLEHCYVREYFPNLEQGSPLAIYHFDTTFREALPFDVSCFARRLNEKVTDISKGRIEKIVSN